MITGDQVEAAHQWWCAYDGDRDWWEGPIPSHQFTVPSWTPLFPSHHGKATVETVALWPVNRGACDCEWRGPVRYSEMAAWADVLTHLDPDWDLVPLAHRSPRDTPARPRKAKTPPVEPMWPTVAGLPLARVHVCGPEAVKDRDDALGLCRGSIPGKVLEMCANPAHHDIGAARRFRWSADGQRALHREQHQRKVQYANAPLAEAARHEGPWTGCPDETHHCGPRGDGNHLFCRWEDCPCWCHSPYLLAARHETMGRWGDHALEGFVRGYGPHLPPPPPMVRPAPERQLALF